MNAATSFVPVIMAAVTQARRKIVAHFLVYHAISADEAVPFVPAKGVMQGQFRQMLAKGIVREGASGGYWIDRAAYRKDNAMRRNRLVPIVLVLALLAAAIPLLFYRD